MAAPSPATLGPLFDAAPDLLGFDATPAAPSNLTLMPKRTLRDRIEGVEFLADTIESLDSETLDDATRDELGRALIAELAGTRAKVDAVAATLALFESLEAAAIAERDRLAKRAATYARRAQRLSDYVLATLEASKLDKLEGNTSTLARRLNPAAVVLDPDAKFASEFLRHKPAPPPEPDKALIKRALQAHRDVPGASLTQNVRLVRS